VKKNKNKNKLMYCQIGNFNFESVQKCTASEEGLGSNRAVVPMMMMMVMWGGFVTLIFPLLIACRN
jgi:hypothetical protein